MIKKIWAGATLIVLCIPVFAAAAEVRTGEQPSLPANETINDDLYIAGGNVSSSGKVNGDLIAAGGTVLISSAVLQDLIVGGGSITILGNVGDDIRVGGGNITISSKVVGDVVAGGGQVQISGAGIGGDVLWGGGTIRIEAPVAGSLMLAGGNVYINSPIKGNVEFKGDKLTLGSGAVIQGNLTYASANPADIQQGAVVRGETKYEKQESKANGAMKAGIATFLTLALLAKFLMTLASALAFGLIFQKYAIAMVRGAAAGPLLELGRGFAVVVITPIASVVLLVTVLGIPLGLLGLVAFVAMCIFASIAGPIVLGSVVHKLTMKPNDYQVTWLTILIGVVLYSILGWIPIIGWLARFVIFLITLGATMKIKWDVVKSWR